MKQLTDILESILDPDLDLAPAYVILSANAQDMTDDPVDIYEEHGDIVIDCMQCNKACHIFDLSILGRLGIKKVVFKNCSNLYMEGNFISNHCINNLELLGPEHIIFSNVNYVELNNSVLSVAKLISFNSDDIKLEVKKSKIFCEVLTIRGLSKLSVSTNSRIECSTLHTTRTKGMWSYRLFKSGLVGSLSKNEMTAKYEIEDNSWDPIISSINPMAVLKLNPKAWPKLSKITLSENWGHNYGIVFWNTRKTALPFARPRWRTELDNGWYCGISDNTEKEIPIPFQYH